MGGGYLYYDKTGDEAVDNILEKIRLAGSMFHHTSEWPETDENFPVSLWDQIQETVKYEIDKLRSLLNGEVKK